MTYRYMALVKCQDILRKQTQLSMQKFSLAHIPTTDEEKETTAEDLLSEQ